MLWSVRALFDAALRPLIDPPLDAVGRRLAAAGVSADALTLGGFAVGLLAIPLLAAGAYGAALVAILINRLADGLDGAVARRTRTSDLGGYLDIVCDFLFYAAVVFGFALAAPENRLPGAFLLFAFIGTGSSFLAFAALAARRGV
jgi:phosphatidylglycerophosphate synthase